MDTANQLQELNRHAFALVLGIMGASLAILSTLIAINNTLREILAELRRKRSTRSGDDVFRLN